MKKIILLIASIIASRTFDGLFAQQLDISFSVDGVVTTDMGAGYDVSYAVAIQPDGKLVVGGYSDNGTNDKYFAVARFNSNGTFDNSFGGDGKVLTDIGSDDDIAYCLAIQSDGKIVMAGVSFNGTSNDFAVVRYNEDGSLDNSFSSDGKVTTNFDLSPNDEPRGIAIQADGKIVVAGHSGFGLTTYDFALARYNADGTLDNTFDSDGMVTTNFNNRDEGNAVVIQPDGKILVTGYCNDKNGFALCRYNTDGSLDSSFSSDGKLTASFGIDENAAYSVTIQSDGKIIAAGNAYIMTYSRFALARFLPDGTLDSTFSYDGKLTTAFFTSGDHARSVAVQPDGKIVASGYTHNYYTAEDNFALARYNADGISDTSFSADGKQLTSIGIENDYGYSMVLQADGKIVLAGLSTTTEGNADFALVRYNTTGSLDSTFASEAVLLAPIGESNDESYALAIQPDGKILTVGSSYNSSTFHHFAISRHFETGIPDSTFGKNGMVTTPVRNYLYDHDRARSVALQSDGKIVVAGYTWDFEEDFALVRYNEDGTLDSSFSNDGIQTTDFGAAGEDDQVQSVTIQSDGKIVVAGTSEGDFALARYNADGTLDNTFSSDGKLTTSFGSSYSNAYSLAIQTDGKIIVAGDSIFSYSDIALVRYNANGTLDTSFGSDGKITTSVGDYSDNAYSVAIQSNGKIIVGGQGMVGVYPEFALVRYNYDGSPDSSFGLNGITTTQFVSNSSDVINSIAIQTDGKIVAAGISQTLGNNYFALARYNPDGSLDNNFGIDGKITTDLGTVYQNAYSVTIQQDGKIVVTGLWGNIFEHDFILIRYLSEFAVGVIDFTTAINSQLIYPNPISHSATLKYILQSPETISIRLFDLEGKILKTFIENENVKAGEHEQIISLPKDLPSGPYLIVISNMNGGRESIKIAKSR